MNNENTIPSVQSEHDLIDLTVLSDLLGGNMDKVEIFANKFLQSATKTQEEITVASADKNLERLRELGHRFKSVCRAIGANYLADLCEKLENLEGDNAIEEAKLIIKDIGLTMSKIEHYLIDYYQNKKTND